MNTMTPLKTLTDGQIGKIKDNLDVALRKASLQSEPAQQVLETKGQGDLMIAEMVAVARKFVGAVSNWIGRLVQVDRTRTPQQALDATGRAQYKDQKVVDAMPRGEGEQAEVIFFKPDESAYKDGSISDDELEKQYELRGLKPCDPYSLSAVNEVDPAFADEKPNATHWKDSNGKWCYAAFGQWRGDERSVSVYRYGLGWPVHWWFAGLRK